MGTGRHTLTLYTAAHYCIRARGRLDPSWGDYLGGLQIAVTSAAPGEPVTTLTGVVSDQAALLGILNEINALGFPLISVEWVTPGRH